MTIVSAMLAERPMAVPATAPIGHKKLAPRPAIFNALNKPLYCKAFYNFFCFSTNSRFSSIDWAFNVFVSSTSKSISDSILATILSITGVKFSSAMFFASSICLSIFALSNSVCSCLLFYYLLSSTLKTLLDKCRRV